MNYIIEKLADDVKVFNQNVYGQEKDKYLMNQFEYLEKYHNIHYNFEETWKFSGVTKSGRINPSMIEKL